MRYTYEEANAYIAEVPKFTKTNEPSNTVELLDRLGHPEDAFKVIHVAGTNGKGSVCAFLEGMLRAAGYRTGLFTSPHLVRINERFQIDRQEISDERFTGAFNVVKEAIDQMVAEGFHHPTYFEILFAVGMVAFREEKIECLVMETGLGGRLDATNTVAHPVCCVITSISLDHTAVLGDTVEQIAGEKAGIIKEGIPVVYDATDRRAEGVIQAQAVKMHAPHFPFYPQMAQITQRSDKGIAFVLNNRYYDYVSVSLPFLADYQAANCSIAMMAMKAAAQTGLLGERAEQMDDRMICEAVSTVRGNGRMEMILPDVVIDGAHNADGIAQFLQTVSHISSSRKVSLLFAAVADKDYEEMIREICACAPFTSITVTQVGESRQVDAQVFSDIFRKYTKAPVFVKKDVREAFLLALEQKEDSMLFCAGSLYLVGEIKAILEEKKVQSH